MFSQLLSYVSRIYNVVLKLSVQTIKLEPIDYQLVSLQNVDSKLKQTQNHVGRHKRTPFIAHAHFRSCNQS